MPEYTSDEPLLGPRYVAAFALACEVHSRQLRKSTRIPYIAHLMLVSALILEFGGDEACAIAASTNESGVLVKNSGKLTLTNVVVSTTSKSSSSDASSFYGLASGVLASTGAAIQETAGSVTTTGDGANAVFAYGTGPSVVIAGTKVAASGQFAHGIMASGGGAITATNLDVSTAGASSAAVVTDRGGGTIRVTGGTYRTAGGNAPGLYSTGTFVASGATFVATGAEAAVVEGANSITVTNTSLTGTKNRGEMIYQSMSGDTQGVKGAYTQTGGSLTALAGPLFFVNNSTGTITLSGVRVAAAAGTVLDAAASTWGTSGANGGNIIFTACRQSLSGNVTVDDISTAALTLKNGSTLTGAINSAKTAKRVSLALDASSRWMLTGNSDLTVLSDSAGISGATISNIVGNGHTVSYNASADPALGDKTYGLVGGGTLTPA